VNGKNVIWVRKLLIPGFALACTCQRGLFPVIKAPEDLGIMVDKQLLNNSCKVEEMVQIPIKSDQISPCISNYEIK